MSLNRRYCDSRCTCFPVELELQHIAIAPKLMHKSLPTTPRPSPDRERCLIRDLYRKLFEIRAKGFLPKRSNRVRRTLCCSDVLPSCTTEILLSPELVVSIGRTWNGSKGRSSSVRLSLRRPHYRRHFVNALRLAALRPVLSRRFALIGESYSIKGGNIAAALTYVNRRATIWISERNRQSIVAEAIEITGCCSYSWVAYRCYSEMEINQFGDILTEDLDLKYPLLGLATRSAGAQASCLHGLPQTFSLEENSG